MFFQLTLTIFTILLLLIPPIEELPTTHLYRTIATMATYFLAGETENVSTTAFLRNEEFNVGKQGSLGLEG